MNILKLLFRLSDEELSKRYVKKNKPTVPKTPGKGKLRAGFTSNHNRKENKARRLMEKRSRRINRR